MNYVLKGNKHLLLFARMVEMFAIILATNINKSQKQICPKCGGAVTKAYENGKTEKEEWNKEKGIYEKKIYYDDNICTSFKWVESYKAIDMNLKHFFDFFTRRETKPDGSFVEYMVVDGERFDAPPNANFMFFFWKNNMQLFPSNSKGEGTIFFYENNKQELGQAVGLYGHAWKHYVYLYTCSKCNHKYDIIRTSPFRFRDASLDKFIDSPKEYKKVNEGNQEMKEMLSKNRRNNVILLLLLSLNNFIKF